MEFDLLCLGCKHYDNKNNNCAAFKNEIPEEIYVGLNNHEAPLPGQENEIVFEPIS